MTPELGDQQPTDLTAHQAELARTRAIDVGVGIPMEREHVTQDEADQLLTVMAAG